MKVVSGFGIGMCFASLLIGLLGDSNVKLYDALSGAGFLYGMAIVVLAIVFYAVKSVKGE